MKFNKSIKNSLQLQRDQTDCGVACLATIIKHFGGQKSLEQLRELSGTSTQGTTMLGLYQAAENCEFSVQGIEADIEYLKNIESPVILHVLIDERLLHYIVCFGYENGKFIIADPAFGLTTYTEEELVKIWQSSALLTLQPNDKFVKAEIVKRDKIEWFKQLVNDDADLLGVVFGLSVIISILGMALAIYSQKLIDDILPSDDIKKLVTGTILLLVLLLAKGFISYYAGLFSIIQSKQFNNRLINQFFGNLLHLPKSFFDNRRIGELVARMNDTSRIQSTISLVIGDLLKNALLVIVGMCFLFSYSGVVGLIILGSFPLFGLISYRFHNRIVSGQRDVMSANAHKSSNYVNTMQGIDTVKAFNKQDRFGDINKMIYGNLQEKVFHLGNIGINLKMVAEIAGIIIMVSLITVGSWLVFIDDITTGSLMAILGIAGSIFPGITSLAFANITLQGAKVAFDRMYEFSSIRSEFNADTQLEKEKITEEFSFEKLIINDVTFRFPGRKQILAGVNMSLKLGEVVALLGESGGGKTTLLNIILNFYKPESGGVQINDKNLDEYSIPEYRNSIGVVPQDIAIFNGTLLENICLSAGEEEIKECIRFCKETGFEKYFTEFSQGYTTILGEEGINVSGGQKQLIGLCRALLRNPSLLLLDEPTSAMDRNTENFALNLLNTMKHRCGVVLVTHQLKIANVADNIYILQDGTIQSSGTKEELLKSENLYSQLYSELTF